MQNFLQNKQLVISTNWYTTDRVSIERQQELACSLPNPNLTKSFMPVFTFWVSFISMEQLKLDSSNLQSHRKY